MSTIDQGDLSSCNVEQVLTSEEAPPAMTEKSEASADVSGDERWRDDVEEHVKALITASLKRCPPSVKDAVLAQVSDAFYKEQGKRPLRSPKGFALNTARWRVIDHLRSGSHKELCRDTEFQSDISYERLGTTDDGYNRVDLQLILLNALRVFEEKYPESRIETKAIRLLSDGLSLDRVAEVLKQDRQGLEHALRRAVARLRRIVEEED